MKLWELYKYTVEQGILCDPRGPEKIACEQERLRRQYDELPQAEKEWADTELLLNPYSDTRILWGDPETEIQHLFVGIDIGVSELLLVDRLNQKGAGIDAVMAHHPEGLALTTLHKSMDLQTDIFHAHGVPIHVAEQILQREADKTHFEITMGNYNRVVDAARLLALPLITAHTPTDNLVQYFLEEEIKHQAPYYVSDILELLANQPEYNEARKLEAGPKLLAGNEKNRCGRIMVDMTGGTDAGIDLYEKLGQSDIGTIVTMHVSASVRDVLAKHHVNIIQAGHMSSDSLGLNLLMDQLETHQITIMAGSGFTRFRRDPHSRKLLH